MDEFEAGTKRAKTGDKSERTMYDNSNRTDRAMQKAMHKPMGGKFGNKRQQKDRNKAHSSKKQQKENEDAELLAKMKNLKNYYNQLRVKKGDLKPNKEQRKELMDHLFEIIDNDYKKIIFKHDGCRVLQSMLKNGNVEHRERIITGVLPFFADLLTQKYSYHLALKMVEFCPNDKLHSELLSKVINRIGKFIMHMFAAEVIGNYLFTFFSF